MFLLLPPMGMVATAFVWLNVGISVGEAQKSKIGKERFEFTYIFQYSLPIVVFYRLTRHKTHLIKNRVVILVIK